MTTLDISPELRNKLRVEESKRVYPITVHDTVNTRGSHGITQARAQDDIVLDLLPGDVWNLCPPLTLCVSTGKICCRDDDGKEVEVELEVVP